MSETEHVKGVATKLEVNVELSWSEQVKLIEDKYCLYAGEWADEEDNNFDNPFVEFANGSWWSILKENVDPYSDIARSEQIEHDKFEFECKWYNGGASFNEVLGQALKS